VSHNGAAGVTFLHAFETNAKESNARPSAKQLVYLAGADSAGIVNAAPYACVLDELVAEMLLDMTPELY